MDGKSKYSGMTVNERLYVSGLIDKYYEAVKEKNVDAASSIHKSVDLGENNITAILKFDGLVNDDY
jgi:DNA/RNA endonuclease YhcR with UshA esterase domain